MKNQIFVNLPVKDLAISRNFYTSLGFEINEQFSDPSGSCVVISDTIFVMLLTYEKFKQFTAKTIADATKSVQVLNALSMANRHQVDEMAVAALTNGGTEARPAEDLGFMYTRAINDPDGHIWEIFYMDMSAYTG